MKRVSLFLVLSIFVAVTGCTELYYGASNTAAMLTPLPDISWTMRLSSVLHSDIQVSGGFAGEGIAKTVSFDQTFPFKGKPGEAFQGKAPMVLSIDWGGDRREIVVPLQELVKQPIHGEFKLEVTAQGVELSVRKYTGGKSWSPGTGLAGYQMENPVALFSSPWHRTIAIK